MNKEFEILKEHLDDEVLDQMPEWFKRIRARYLEKLTLNKR